MNFYVADFLAEGAGVDEAISACITAAAACEETATVIFDRQDYCITRAITVPSNTTIVVDDCTIYQKDLTFDSVFRGANVVLDPACPHGLPLEASELSNVRILGKGDAKIKGPDVPATGYHTFFEEEQVMVGDFWGHCTHMFSFSNVENIEIAGLKLSQTTGWAICFDHCCEVYVHDLDIRSDVKNGDGVDMRSGCHHCVVENITGSTSDDTVACTALSAGKTDEPYPRKSKYLWPSEPYNQTHENIDGNIHDITIRNIFTGGRCHGIICLAARGNQVYNVSIDNVVDGDSGDRQSSVKIYTGYGDGYTSGDIHNITVRNITSNISKHAVQIAADIDKVSIDNITQNNPNGDLIYCGYV